MKEYIHRETFNAETQRIKEIKWQTKKFLNNQKLFGAIKISEAKRLAAKKIGKLTLFPRAVKRTWRITQRKFKKKTKNTYFVKHYKTDT